ncbi:MAG: hypothetical protein B6I24_10900 [Bacteroidetes bacterium 4572_128]|nr:MAG: hypothetical protein B6I24_10900 [Bacteroidetes bacterium 4572_128]
MSIKNHIGYLAPLNYDIFFRKVFKDKSIAKDFLQDFLEIEISSIEELKNKYKLTDEFAV